MVLLVLLMSSVLCSSWALPEPRKLSGKIVGGSTTTIDKYPYQVSVLHYDLHTCGGTLLDTDWIITAAHCVKDAPTSTLSVRLGTSFRNVGGEVIRVAYKYVHPKFDGTKLTYDIAVLKLITKLPPNDPAIKSVDNLAPFWVDGRATVTGWGSTEEEGSPSSQLRQVEVDLIDTETCALLYGNNLIQDTMICAGILPVGGSDACQGDSGGPLVVHDPTDGSATLVGVVSWGYGCARPNYPGVYSSVAELGDWIMSVVVPRPI